MMDLDRWTEIAASLRNNRLRTVLTAAGVFWGMFMLVVMLGFGDGLERGVKRNMSGFATNAVYIWGGRTSIPHAGMRPGRWISYDNSDVEALSQLASIEHLAPRNRLGGWRGGSLVVRGAEAESYAVMGDVPAFRHIAPVIFEQGRFLNDLDMAEHRKVAVIGRRVYEELFPTGEDPIGDHIRINGVWFQVVGVFRSTRADDRGDRDNGTIHIPFTTFQRAFNVGDRVGWIAMTAHPESRASDLEAEVKQILSERKGIHPDDQAIGSYNAEEEFRKLTTLFTGIRFFVWFVGTMTLAAGVVGVSNIMLIVVQERRKEIGLRRAIGATPASVVAMVVQESVVLTAVAGYAGLVAAVLVIEAAGPFVGGPGSTMDPPQLDVGAALVAAGVLLVAGGLAGVFPARNAALVAPVEALQAE